MKRSGQIVLASFPYTDFSDTKLRPVLMLRQVSASFDDWLVCMVSSQIQQIEEGLDEIITPADADFPATGLKVPSILRISRLAVLDGKLLVGSIGSISDERLMSLRKRLAKWISEMPGP